MDEATGSQPLETPSIRSRLTPVFVVVLLMIGEGIGVFLLANAIGSDPVSAAGAEGVDGPEAPGQIDQYAEVELVECRPSNKMAGKFINFHIRVSALVSTDDLERAEGLVRAKRARLEDGVNTVIRAADPKHFNEPGYETIKRRLRQEFDQIFGDDRLVKKVLIPQMLQSGPGV